MISREILGLSAGEIRSRVVEGALTSEQVAACFHGRCARLNPDLNAMVWLNEPGRAATSVGSAGALAGVPVCIKDNLCVRGEPTTCASRILAGFKPPYDATVIAKLRRAGAYLLGKTNMDEFAFGSSCETSCYGPTRNPFDRDRIPGGSSGGAACAVAAGLAPLALGSDTGGSIRQPAALCGVTGLKPTYGRVSRYGLIAFASSLDQIGPIARTVSDCARLLTVIAGHDPLDSTSVDIPVPDYENALSERVSDLCLGVPREYFIPGIDPEVLERVRSAIEVFKKMGARVIDIDLPHTRYAVSCYYVIAPAEASSNLARFDGVQYGLRRNGTDIREMYCATRSEGFGREAKRRILLGTYALSSGYYDAYYLKALKVRTKIRQDFQEAFRACDCIITPTTPTPAFRLGEKTNDPLAMYLSDIFTIPANLAGLPALSINCGNTAAGLPVGLQIMGRPFDEQTVLRAAYAFECATGFALKKPLLMDEGARPA